MANANKYIDLALDKIRQTEYEPAIYARLAAVLVKGGNIISIGRNKSKLNRYTKMMAPHENCVSIHAEVDAIFGARRKIDLRGTVMYVARLTKQNQTGLAAPCSMCMETLQRYGIKKVFYTVENNGHEMLRVQPMLIQRKKRH
jgi:deoxycytidylate deaminase